MRWCKFSIQPALALKVLFFSFLAAEAQTDSLNQAKKYSGHFMFSVGLAEPLGELASQNYAKSSSGAANTGLGIQFVFHKPISKHIGFCLAFHRESFLLNEEELSRVSQSVLPPGYTAKVEVLQNWSVSGLQAGLNARIPLTSKRVFFLEPRVMLGIGRAKSPGYITSIDSIVPQAKPTLSINQSSAKSSNLSGTFLIGLGLNYYAKSNWCFALHFDYVNLLSEAEFDDIQITSSTNQNFTGSWDMEMKYYTIRLGIGKMIGY